MAKTGLAFLAILMTGSVLFSACEGDSSGPDSDGLSVTIAPTTLIVARGGSAAATVTVSRTGTFAGPIALTADGLPTGVTAIFDPATIAVGGTTSSLTVTAGTATPIGNTAVTVRATGTDVTAKTATLTLSVTSAGAQVTLDYSRCSGRPVWLAFQDGSGPWTPVAPNNDVYTFVLHSPRAGLAIAQPPDRRTIMFLSRDEILALEAMPDRSCRTAPSKNLVATVSGLDRQSLRLALAGTSAATSLNGQVTLHNVADGVYDLMGYYLSEVNSPASDLVFFQRDINTATLPTGTSIGAFHPNSARPLITARYQIAGFSPDRELYGYVWYRVGPRCLPVFLTGQHSRLSTSDPVIYGVPADLQAAADRHAILFTAADGATQERYYLEHVNRLEPRSITLGSHLPNVSPTSLPGSYRRLRFEFTMPQDLMGGRLELVLNEVGGDRRLTVVASTPGYFEGRNIALEIPELSNAAGWNSTWGIPPTSAVDWELDAWNHPAVSSRAAFDDLPACTLTGPVLGASRTGRI